MQKSFSSSSVTLEDVERLLKRIPFFNDVAKHSDLQFHTLIELGDIIEIDPGETIIRKGETDMYLYFLLKGQLAVFMDDTTASPPINLINPGEVFGILSMITATPRSAFIKADTSAKSTLLYKLNFAYLADETATSKLSLATRLIFYRMAVFNIRWMLEQKKMADPRHPMVATLLKLPIIKADKDTVDELDALKQQARNMSEIVFKWNEYDHDHDKTRL